MARDYYAILGITQTATEVEIKRSYRKLARELHPDVNPTEDAKVRFQEVTVAYEVLSDPEKRRVVDAGGDPLASAGGGFGGFNGGFGGGLGDVFEAFFGGGASSSRARRGRVRPGSDALLRITITLEESATGASKEAAVDTAVLCDLCQGAGTNGNSKPTECDTCHGVGEVQTVTRTMLGQMMTNRPCPTCHGIGEVIADPCTKCGGDGRVRARRTITVKIPAGVDEGMRIRLSGQGEVGHGGGPAGDLYVEPRIAQHDVFIRDSDDLHCTVRVPMVDAALGGSVEITAILGESVTVNVEAGTQPGTVVKISGHGMPQVNTTRRGTLHVHLDVVVPSRVDGKQKSLLQQIKAMRSDTIELVTADTANHGGLFGRLRNAFAGR